jgi:hypothetical protein
MGQVMPLHRSRARAERAFQMRAIGWTWHQIADALEYRSHGAAQTAVKRHERRTAPESVESSRRSLIESVKISNRVLFARFAAAADREDDKTIAMLNGELCRNRDQLAKLTGAYMPERAELDVNVHQTPGQILADAQERVLAIIDAEIEDERREIE